MRNQTGINAIEELYGVPSHKKFIDLRPKPKPTQLKQGGWRRKRQPRAGTGTHETAKMAYDFMEPGYVHAARTGTIPESIFGKAMLGVETTLDLAPGLGKVVSAAIPFGLMRKVDPVEIQRKTINIGEQISNTDIFDVPTLEKYMPEQLAMSMHRLPPVQQQKDMLETTNLLDLIQGATKKETKKWRESVKSLPASQRVGFPIHNIDTMYPAGSDTGAILADQIGSAQNMDDLAFNPNLPLFQATARAQGNIETASKRIIEKLGSGEIERTVGHKQKAKLLKDYIAAEADRQAHLKAFPQVQNKRKEIFRESKTEAMRLGDKYEADEVTRLYEEHAFGKGHGDESAKYFLPEFQAQAANDAKHYRAEEFMEQINARTEAKAIETVKRSIPAQTKEIKNQIQETGTYDPKNRMQRGFGEDAEALRQMQKNLQSYNPMNMRIRSV